MEHSFISLVPCRYGRGGVLSLQCGGEAWLLQLERVFVNHLQGYGSGIFLLLNDRSYVEVEQHPSQALGRVDVCMLRVGLACIWSSHSRFWAFVRRRIVLF